MAFAVAEPADPGGQALEVDLLLRQPDPPGQRLVLREQLEDGPVGGRDVLRVAGQGGPAERALALAEQRADVGRHESGEVEGPGVPGQFGLTADRVAVVEDLGPLVEETDHGGHVRGHRLAGAAGEALGVLGAQRGHVLEGDAVRQVGERVVGRGLVGDDVDRGVAGQQGREDIRGVAEQADGQRLALVPGGDRAADGIVEVVGLLIEVAVLDPPGDPGLVAVHADGPAAEHRRGQRLRPAHATEAGRQNRASRQVGRAEMALPGRCERLVGALQDALGADVDPRARRHLAVHGQPELLEAAELLPGRPLRDQVGVRDEDPRPPLVGAEHADRLAGLDEQGLVVLQVLERRDDRRVGVPAPGGTAGAAVHDELVGVFGHLGVEVVHQHPHRALGGPALAAALGAAGGVDGFPALRHEPIMAGRKTE